MNGTPIDLAGLAVEVREGGEAYLAIVATENCRLGIEARWDGGLCLELEGEVRLLPPGEVVPATLEPALRRLSGLSELGFRLHYFEESWVLATRPVKAEEATEVIEASVRLLAPEPFCHHRA